MSKKVELFVENFINDNKYKIFEKFEKIVNINSFSSNIEGIKKVYQELIGVSKDEDLEFEIVYSSKKERPHLMYQKDLKKDYYAIIGHVDTVHPPKSGFDKIVQKDGLYIGPGTNDMKSGIIVALYSLIILKKIYPGMQLPFKVLFNSDEEIGSYDSKELIQNEFKEAIACFVFEPGRLPGYQIVTGRKGVFNIDVYIKGKPSHAGVAPKDGINAILAASKIIQKLDGLNDFENGITISCNTIEGGTAVNVIASFCKFSIDGRYKTKEQGIELFKRLDEILREDNELGSKVSFKMPHHRPPMQKSEEADKLYKLYKDVSLSLGVKCEEASTGGGSDANFLSAMGIPSLDGLGAFGAHSHTQKEYTLKETILQKIKIFTIFAIKLIEKNQKEKT